MEPNVKYLINWTQRDQCAGGTESRYQIIKKAFPKAKLISANNLTYLRSITSLRIAVDDFILENTNKDDVVIRDAGVGGTIKHESKQVLLFGNPYYSLLKKFPRNIASSYWLKLIEAQKEDGKREGYHIANSVFSKIDAEASNCSIDAILYNAVDIDFWKPSEVEKEYILWNTVPDMIWSF